MNKALLYVTLVAGIALPESSLPIGYEFSAELSFPVHESVANGLLLFTSQVISTSFYIAFGVLTYGSTSSSGVNADVGPYGVSSPGTTPIPGAGTTTVAGGAGHNESVFERNAQLLWWFSAAICLLSALSLVPVRSSYRRLALDDHTVNSDRVDRKAGRPATDSIDVPKNQINDVSSSAPEAQVQTHADGIV